MSYTEKTKKILWGKSGGKCAFPECERDLIGKEDNIQGEICHIVARNEGGPRWRTDFLEDIDGEENLISLCSEHHKIIDDFPEKYTEELIHQYKSEHEEIVRARMNIGEPWKVNFSQIYYMHIPRIEMLAALKGINFDGEIQRDNAFSPIAALYALCKAVSSSNISGLISKRSTLLSSMINSSNLLSETVTFCASNPF